jgi:hypothetical protein
MSPRRARIAAWGEKDFSRPTANPGKAIASPAKASQHEPYKRPKGHFPR